MRTSEGTTIWYLRVIHHLAQSGEVWTLDIKGEEWGEVDFPRRRRGGARADRALGRGGEGRGGLRWNAARASRWATTSVSALLIRPDGREGALRVRAWRRRRDDAPEHGRRMREGLAERGIATLRYQFPYMEKGSKATRPAADRACGGARGGWRRRRELAPDLPLFAGGRSFGGRMTSQAQAEAPLPGVRGLAFLGFPLHPAGKPGDRPRRSSGAGANPDAVRIGRSRRAGGDGFAESRSSAASASARRCMWSPTPTIASRCR